MISVVIPAYNESESIKPLYERLVNVLNKQEQSFEVIFIDDGSSDNTCDVVENIHNDDKRVKLIKFRKNFGKSLALSAGFEKAKGDFIFTMDADLQDQPEEIPKFIEELNKGYDLVSGWKKQRFDPSSKTLPSKVFNKVVSTTSGLDLHDINCGFKLYRRKVLENISIYGELHRFIPVLAAAKGFKVGEVVIEHSKRQFGYSKFGSKRLFNGLFDFLTVFFITRYLQRPMHFFGFIGLLFIFLGSVISGYFIFQWISGVPMHVRPMMVFGIALLIIGVQFISLGLLGEMQTRLHSSQKIDYQIVKLLE